MDETEVTNFYWMDYLSFIRNEEGVNSERYINALPDSIAWSKAYPDACLMGREYRDYPVVGITYQQALDYCRWRTEMVSVIYPKKGIVYYLPDKEVFLKVASNVKAKSVKTKCYSYSNTRRYNKVLGLYDNVSELTAVQGEILAGNYLQPNTDITTNREESVPNYLIGFRCVARLGVDK